MNILHLSAAVPSPSSTGGRSGVYRHVCDLVEAGHRLELVSVDGDRCGESMPSRFEGMPQAIFPALAATGSTLSKGGHALSRFAFDRRPWPVSMIRTPAALSYVERRLREGRWDAVIADHLRAFGLIDDADVRLPIVLMAHNVEARLMQDELQHCEPGTLRYWFTARTLARLRAYEAEAMRRAACVVAVSNTDAEVLARDRGAAGKPVVWLELPEPKPERWQYRATRRLLFVGTARHFPNVEAIRWLVRELMPRIRARDSSVRLAVVGASRVQAGIAVEDDHVDFLGFVPDGELARAHLESDLFVSAVTLGSGVKTKVLEAASWGMPVMLTPECTHGLEFLQGAARVASRDDAEAFAGALLTLLNDPPTLLAMHRETIARTEAARAARRPLGDIVREAVG